MQHNVTLSKEVGCDGWNT